MRYYDGEKYWSSQALGYIFLEYIDRIKFAEIYDAGKVTMNINEFLNFPAFSFDELEYILFCKRKIKDRNKE